MNREAELRLIDFCAQQHRAFVSADWVRFDAVKDLEKAATARYLAGVDWYGNRAELGRLADDFSPSRFAELAAATGFDPSRFAGLLKTRLARATLAR